MNTTPAYLSRENYDRLLLAALTSAHGLTHQQADSLIASRWPLAGPGGCVNEAHGRGLYLDVNALGDYFRERFAEQDQAVLQDVIEHLHCTGIWPDQFDELLAWAVANGRATQTPEGRMVASRPGCIDDMQRRAAARMN